MRNQKGFGLICNLKALTTRTNRFLKENLLKANLPLCLKPERLAGKFPAYTFGADAFTSNFPECLYAKSWWKLSFTNIPR